MATMQTAEKQKVGDSSAEKKQKVTESQSSMLTETAEKSNPTPLETDQAANGDKEAEAKKSTLISLRCSKEEMKRIKRDAFAWAVKQDEPPDSAVADYLRFRLFGNYGK